MGVEAEERTGRSDGFVPAGDCDAAAKGCGGDAREREGVGMAPCGPCSSSADVGREPDEGREDTREDALDLVRWMVKLKDLVNGDGRPPIRCSNQDMHIPGRFGQLNFGKFKILQHRMAVGTDADLEALRESMPYDAATGSEGQLGDKWVFRPKCVWFPPGSMELHYHAFLPFSLHCIQNKLHLLLYALQRI